MSKDDARGIARAWLGIPQDSVGNKVLDESTGEPLSFRYRCPAHRRTAPVACHRAPGTLEDPSRAVIIKVPRLGKNEKMPKASGQTTVRVDWRLDVQGLQDHPFNDRTVEQHIRALPSDEREQARHDQGRWLSGGEVPSEPDG